MSKLSLSRALAEHHEGVVQISIGVYRGNDYAPTLYQKWMEEESEDKEARRSLVLLDEDGKVLGFQSYFLMKGPGSRILAVQQALRIDRSLVGQGVGRRFMELGQQYLKQNFPRVTEVKSVALDCDQDPENPKIGRLICGRLERAYTVDLKVGKSSGKELEYHGISKLSLEEVVRRVGEDFGRFSSLCLENGYFTAGWIPFYIGSASDLRRARPYCSDLHFVLGSLNGGSSFGGLSVVTQPYRVVTGPCAAMDIYAENEEDFKAHAKIQLRHLRSLFAAAKDAAPSSSPPPERTTLLFGCRKSCLPFLDEFMEGEDMGELGLRPFNMNGSKTTDVRRNMYYIYEKELQ